MSDTPARVTDERDPVGLLLSPTSPRGRQTLDGVLDAAIDVFGGAGNGRRPSVAAVADRVGISPAAVYQYFSDREALVLAAAERDTARLVASSLEESLRYRHPVLTGEFLAVSERRAAEHPLAVCAVSVQRRDVLALPLARAEFDRVRAQFEAELEAAQGIGAVRDDAPAEILADELVTALVYSMWAEAIGPGRGSPAFQAMGAVFAAALFQPAPDLRTPQRRDEFLDRLRRVLSAA